MSSSPVAAKWYNSIDGTSFANVDDVRVVHHKLAFEIDFAQKAFRGSVTFVFDTITSNLNAVTLDSKCIQIQNVTFEGQDLKFSVIQIPPHNTNLGDLLEINLPHSLKTGDRFQITVHFQTEQSDQPTAINWLTPEQTQGKKHAYVFTQSEPIYNRTIFPCQDTPTVKSTFTAQILVEKPYIPWVSGHPVQTVDEGSKNRFFFEQFLPIPSYLFALVCGNLAEKKVSDRTSVIAEPEIVDQCAEEFSQMEKYLTELEAYTTKYEWKVYRIVVLPPSFPYGGMENPVLTFASPTIVVGDQSQTEVVIHEMAHSWSGNLVTCGNWESFWLNEGWTKYLENEIFRRINGEEAYRIRSALDNLEVRSTIDRISEPSYTTLSPEINNDNPDDAFSLVPYVRGCQFLTYLRSFVGEQRFMKFAKSYFTTFRNQAIVTSDFKIFFEQFVRAEFGDYEGNKILLSVKWREWLSIPGQPPADIDFSCQSIDRVNQLVDLFLQNQDEFYKNTEEFKKLSLDLTVFFLNQIGEHHKDITIEQVKKLDETFQYTTDAKNPEITTKWWIICIRKLYNVALPQIKKHLSTIGRMKYILVIYRELMGNGYKKEAQEYFKENYGFYHPIARSIAESIVSKN